MDELTTPVVPRVLVLGGGGMLGREVVSSFEGRGWPVSSPSHADLDITSLNHLEHLRKKDYGQFDWVVNCAAYTNVDLAESETMAAMTLNGIAPGSVSAVCAENGWRFLHVSSDFVFDGSSTTPYTESMTPNPLGTYGKSKLLGEQNVRAHLPTALIVRTAWLYGVQGKCFPKSIIQAWLQEKPLRVVADQTGSPTSCVDLARTLGDLISQDAAGGVYHATGPDAMSWHAFAVSTLESYKRAKGLDRLVEVEPIRSEEWPTPAKRPSYSVLSNQKLWDLGIPPMRPVNLSLQEFCEGLTGPL